MEVSPSSSGTVSSQAASSSSAAGSHYKTLTFTEMRGVWVVTAYHIEFPKAQSNAAAQKKELQAIVDAVKAVNPGVSFGVAPQVIWAKKAACRRASVFLSRHNPPI
ncbi:MAG: hypothetical protein P4M02_02175 [Clostridia bacterium]|nr:hypothetical protein [Clostridia bacterium]